MSTNTRLPDDRDDLAGDIAHVGSLLDALGAADRGAIPSDATDRIAASAFPAILHPEMADSAATSHQVFIAAHAHEAGAAHLEQHAFEASRPELGAPARPRLVGSATPAPIAVPVVHARRWALQAARLAAAVAIVAGGVAAFIVLRPSTSTPAAAVSLLAQSVDSEMAEFFDLLESTTSGSSAADATSVDHSVTDDLLEWESL